MLSLISFIIVVVGGLNWLCIGMLQYDFVAGMFGSQANIFSRIVYVIVGLMTVYMIFLAIRYKGKVIGGEGKINFAFWKKKKKDTANEHDDVTTKQATQPTLAHSNVQDNSTDTISTTNDNVNVSNNHNNDIDNNM